MSIPNTRILFSIKHGRSKNIFTSFTSRFPIKLQLQDFFFLKTKSILIRRLRGKNLKRGGRKISGPVKQKEGESDV